MKHSLRQAMVQLPCMLCTLLLACGDHSAGAIDTDILLMPTTEDVYSVGTLSGEDWENFTRVAKVAFDASGNLHIFDPLAKRIVVVDRAGGFLREVGGEGEGPGELSSPFGFEILRDGRIVIGDSPATLQVYDGEGGFIEEVDFDLSAGAPGSLLIARPDSRLVSRGGRRRIRADQERDEPEDPHLRDIEVFTLDGSDKEVLYRAWNLEPTEVAEELKTEDEQGRETSTTKVVRTRAFEPGLHLGMLSDGRLAVVDSMAYRIKLIGPQGSVVVLLERQLAPEPVTLAVREAERARRREAFSTPGAIHVEGVEDREFAERLRATLLEQVENMVFAEVIPVIADMAVGPGDLIWVARTGPGGDGQGPTDILTADGAYIGTLPTDGPEIPDAFGPGGLMAYIETDELDVPVVRVIRLVGVVVPGEQEGMWDSLLSRGRAR